MTKKQKLDFLWLADVENYKGKLKVMSILHKKYLIFFTILIQR